MRRSLIDHHHHHSLPLTGVYSDSSVAMEGQDSPLAMSHEAKAMDSAEIAGLKDGVTVTPSSRSASEEIVLSIKCPSLSDVSAESNILTVPSHCSIGQIKSRIESSWPGRPQVQGMRIFKSGRMLSDDMIVGDIVPPSDRSEPAAIHLVIRPTAWSEPRPSQPGRTSSARVPRRQPSPHPAWVAAGPFEAIPALNNSPKASLLPLPAMNFPQRSSRTGRLTPQEAHLASVIENMEPSNYSSFRSLLTWSYYRYVEMYDELWKEMYGQWSKESCDGTEPSKSVEQLAKGMDCSEDEVLAAVKLVETEALQWLPLEEELAQSNKSNESGMTYKTVTLQGLPYLLQVKRDPRSGPLAILLGRIKRLQDIVHRMDKLISYQTLFEQASNTSALQADMRSRQSAMLAAATAAGNATTNPGVAAPNAPRVRVFRFRLEFNAYNFLNVAVPAFLLSLKMTLLVYVFTRGASTLKTFLIAGAGAVFVLLEAWKTAQRHNRNRQAAARTATPADRPAGDVPTSAGQDVAQEEAGFESLRPRASIRRRALSPLTLDYWVESLAYIGLEAEERQLGWHPLPTADARRRQQSYMAKLLVDQILLPLLLMFVTLIPEIEQKRRRAIDAREDLIRSTAKKVEDRKARLAEKTKEKDDKEAGEGSLPRQEAVDEVPSYLQHPYCQRIIDHRRTGRQIDIAQEMEAAAAAGEGVDQADMGFL